MGNARLRPIEAANCIAVSATGGAHLCRGENRTGSLDGRVQDRGGVQQRHDGPATRKESGPGAMPGATIEFSVTLPSSDQNDKRIPNWIVRGPPHFP